MKKTMIAMVNFNLYGEELYLKSGEKFEVDELLAKSISNLGYAKYITEDKIKKDYKPLSELFEIKPSSKAVKKK